MRGLKQYGLSARGALRLLSFRTLVALSGCALLGVASCQSSDVSSQNISSTTASTDTPELSDATNATPDSDTAISTPVRQTTAPQTKQISQETTNQSIFEGDGFTVTITGFGADASYRGCNAKQECLDIPNAAQYFQGTYTWENGDYSYVMAPINGISDGSVEFTGSYSLNVYGPDNSTLVDAVVSAVDEVDGNGSGDGPEDGGGDVVREFNVLDEFYTQAESLGACPDYLDIDASRDASTVYPINNEDSLVEVLCFLAAYQGAYEYWLYQPSAAGPTFVPLSFDTYTAPESGGRSRIQVRQFGGYPAYDPSQETLTIFSKYRGLGDCGSYSEYQWRGTEFELMTYRSKDDCDGTTLDAIDYPQIYP